MTPAELRLIRQLTDTITQLCDEFCKTPTKINCYNKATQLLKEQENVETDDD